MRDGRRKRLGLGTEDPATSNDGYLDRILSDQEAAEQSNILNLAQDANVNVRDQRYLNDAYQYYLGGGTGNFADEVAIAPDFIGGQLIDTGGGAGQATSGVDLGAGTGNTDFEQNLLDQGIGVQGAIGDPVVAPGEMLSTQAEMDAFNQIPVTPQTYADTGRADLLEQAGGEDYGDGGFQEEGSFDDQFQDIESIGLPETNIVDEVALTGQPTAVNDLGEITADDYGTNTFAGNTATLEDAGGTYDGNQSAEGGFGLESEFAPYGVNPNTGEAYQTPRSISDQNAVLGQTFAAEDVDTQGNLLQSGIDKMKSVFPDFNPIVAAGKIAFNSYIGAPVTLAFDALKAIGGMLPEQSAANKFNQSFTKGGANYKDYGYGVLQAGNIAQDPFGRNPVSAFGNYEETLAEDATYVGDSNFSNAKKQYAEDYFNAKAEKASGVDMEDGTVLGPGEAPGDVVSLEDQLKSQPVTVENISGDYSPDDDDPADDGPAPSAPPSDPYSGGEGGVQSGMDAPSVPEADNSIPDEYDEPDYDPGPFDYQVQPTYQTGTTTRPGSGGGGGGNDSSGKSIVCTAMYQTTGLEDWSKAMKIWYIYQKKYLTIQHQEGYHKLFKPFVKGMHKSQIIRAIGAHVAKHRTQDLKHVMFGSRSSWLGRVYRKILEPVCYLVGKYVK